MSLSSFAAPLGRRVIWQDPRMPALSAFLGRDSERAQLASRIAAHRLVSVVGPGGIGKTRL